MAADARERVIRAAEQLGYRPNVVAGSLVLRRSYAIGLVVPDLANQFFAHVVSGPQRVAVEAWSRRETATVPISSTDNHMTRSIALGTLLLSTLLIAAAYVGALVSTGVPAWAPWSLMIGTSTIMLATMVLGASRGRGGIGRLAVPFAAMFVVLLVGFSAALLMPAEAAGAPLWFGLPPRAAVILYGVGVLPLFVLPVAYAVTFESLTLSEEDLERVRTMKHERERA